MKTGGYLVISLDFELMWGMFDKVSIDSYGENIAAVHTVVPELLEVFRQHQIHATWATVGMLMYKNAEALEAVLPAVSDRPRYLNMKLSSYRHFLEAVQDSTDKERYYFAPELVKKIIATPGQELASHTFSHYYCLEGGENSSAIFAADCTAMQQAANQFGTKLASIVFPRNQTTEDALAITQQAGLRAYRGTESHWLYRSRTDAAQSNPFIRLIRLLDHYLNISGHHTYPVPTIGTSIVNLPASRFLRPHSSLLSSLESLRLKRIKSAMTYAAKHDEVFHLWWHPHNFGRNRQENFKNLQVLLEHFQALKAEYGMESKNMHELVTPELESSVVSANQIEPTTD